MKKLMAMFLALLMLALPVFSLAEGDFVSEAVANGRMVERTTTFQIASTGDATVDQIVGELLSAMSVVTYWQEGDAAQGGLRVNMNGTDILTVDVATTADGTYLRSDLLAGNTVAVKPGDEQSIVEKLMNTLAAEGLIEASDAEAMLAEMNSAMAGAANPLGDVDLEAMMTGFDASALEQVFMELAERVEQSDLSGLPEGSDPAIMAMTLTLNGEDLAKVCNVILDALKDNAEYVAMLDSLLASEENVSGAELLEQMRQQINEELPAAMKDGLPVTVYFNGDDEVVAATCKATMNATMNDGTEPENVAVDFVYYRKTAAEQVNHSIVYNITGESAAVAMTADIVVKADEVASVMASIQDEDTTMNFTYTAEKQVSDTAKQTSKVFALDVIEDGEATNIALAVQADAKKVGEDAEQTTVVKFSLDGQELFTMTTVSKTGAPAEGIATADALRLADLSQEDFQGWFEGVIGNLQVWLMTALQALPSSVLMVMFGQ